MFQPHTYSRTKEHINEFAQSLINFDNIIITDIYAARETNTYGVTSENIVEKIKELGREAVYIPKFEDIVKYLEEKIEKDDIILTLGAGTVTNIGPMLVEN